MSIQISVMFNPEQKKLWERLKKDGQTSQPFPEFVKNAFYEAIDRLNITKITQKQIEKKTQEAIKKA